MLTDAGFQGQVVRSCRQPVQRASRLPHRGLRRPLHPGGGCVFRHRLLLQRARAHPARARIPGRAAPRAEARRHCRAPAADGFLARCGRCLPTIPGWSRRAPAGVSGRRGGGQPRTTHTVVAPGRGAAAGRSSSARILVSPRHGEVGNAVSEALALQPASLDAAVRGDRLARRRARHQRAVLHGLQRSRLAALACRAPAR